MWLNTVSYVQVNEMSFLSPDLNILWFSWGRIMCIYLKSVDLLNFSDQWWFIEWIKTKDLSCLLLMLINPSVRRVLLLPFLFQTVNFSASMQAFDGLVFFCFTFACHHMLLFILFCMLSYPFQNIWNSTSLEKVAQALKNWSMC